MSEQQNPQEVSQSLQQPTALGDDNSRFDSKPFSIRQYVLASRQRDIFHSWPFPEKYLQILLSRGINTVLPPFEPHHSAIRSLRGRPRRSNCSQKNKENVAGSDQAVHQSSTMEQERVSKEEVCDLSKSEETTTSEICSQDYETCNGEDRNDCSPNVSPCSGVVSSGKRLRVKRKWGKGKHKKKKSIINILGVAKTCSSEIVARITRLQSGLSKPLENDGVRGSEGASNGEHISESELTEDQCSKNKLITNDCEGADTEMYLHTKRWVLKYELRNCRSRNSRSRNQGGKGKKALPHRIKTV